MPRGEQAQAEEVSGRKQVYLRYSTKRGKRYR